MLLCRKTYSWSVGAFINSKASSESFWRLSGEQIAIWHLGTFGDRHLKLDYTGGKIKYQRDVRKPQHPFAVRDMWTYFIPDHDIQPGEFLAVPCMDWTEESEKSRGVGQVSWSCAVTQIMEPFYCFAGRPTSFIVTACCPSPQADMILHYCIYMRH